MTTELKMRIKKVCDNAVIPRYATEGAACFDLYSITEGLVTRDAPLVCRTGLVFEVPSGYAMMIYSRSGHGFKNGVRLANCVGVIDSDYRGEVMVKLTNDSDTPFSVSIGDRVAQAMLIPVSRLLFEESDEISDTARGVGGFGSTGR